MSDMAIMLGRDLTGDVRRVDRLLIDHPRTTANHELQRLILAFTLRSDLGFRFLAQRSVADTP